MFETSAKQAPFYTENSVNKTQTKNLFAVETCFRTVLMQNKDENF